MSQMAKKLGTEVQVCHAPELYVSVTIDRAMWMPSGKDTDGGNAVRFPSYAVSPFTIDLRPSKRPRDATVIAMDISSDGTRITWYSERKSLLVTTS